MNAAKPDPSFSLNLSLAGKPYAKAEVSFVRLVKLNCRVFGMSFHVGVEFHTTCFVNL